MYYLLFIPGFSKVASSLFSLTHKGTDFVWNAECGNVLNCLKSLLTSEPFLVFPDFEKEFILETDASGVGLSVKSKTMVHEHLLPMQAVLFKNMKRIMVLHS